MSKKDTSCSGLYRTVVVIQFKRLLSESLSAKTMKWSRVRRVKKYVVCYIFYFFNFQEYIFKNDFLNSYVWAIWFRFWVRFTSARSSWYSENSKFFHKITVSGQNHYRYYRAQWVILANRSMVIMNWKKL